MAKARTRVVRNSWPGAVNAAAVGEVFGVSRQAVEKWVELGCPKGSDGSFSVGSVVAWRIGRERGEAAGAVERELLAAAQESTPALERFREARAAMAEMELGESLGLLVRRSEVEGAAARVVTEFRQKLEGWPATLAPQVEGLTALEISGVLRGAVAEALEALSAGFTTGARGTAGEKRD